jgi:DNA polymerase-4
VGAVTARKLRAQGITTVRQVATLGEGALVQMLGRASGRHIHALAHNRDPRPVQVGRRRRSMGSQRAIGRRSKSATSIDAILIGIVDRLGRRLRAARRVCRTVVLRLRFDDLSRATRSRTLPQSTAHTPTLLATARDLVVGATPLIESQGITLIGLTFTNLEFDGAVQLGLPLDRRWPVDLDAALDELHDRYGSKVITRAVLLGRDQGQSIPLLPD